VGCVGDCVLLLMVTAATHHGVLVQHRHCSDVSEGVAGGCEALRSTFESVPSHGNGKMGGTALSSE
jgi:hypothetical protein